MTSLVLFVYINIVQDDKGGGRCYNWTGWLHLPAMKAYENKMKNFHKTVKAREKNKV